MRPTSLDADVSYGAFLRGMRELGYVQGKNVDFEWRFADGQYERLPALARELVDLQVDVIVAMTPPSVQAAKQATTTIPIVIVAVGDPVALGFVASFARPGGNITGVSNAIDDASRKYLELLRAAVPKLSRVAVLLNTGNPNYRNILRQVQESGQSMDISISRIEASTPEQIVQGFHSMRRTRPDALVVPGDGFFFLQRHRIVELALGTRTPTMFWTREPVEAGGFMSYGQNVVDDLRVAASYVDRILKGAKPRDLPVEQPKQVKLVINLKTANALGLTIPKELLLRADELIE